MSKKTNLKPIAAAIGATFAVSLLSPVVGAAANPFNMNDLSASGYMVAGHDAEGKCGEGMEEGKEEGKAKDEGEGKCGEDKDTSAEGKCGEGKCGEKRKAHEGKCGEGKCGEGMDK
ncbi:MAG: hypothetical protein HYY48_03860 [Gammaproteobacteria bacterium]|nr:hypothetical protein [Gammaproteobacteria bacterium]